MHTNEETGEPESVTRQVPDVGGHFINVTPSLIASLTDSTFLSVSGRLAVWRDANFAGDIPQLVPNSAIYLSFGTSLGGGTPAPVVRADPAKGPKLGEKPMLAELAALLVPGKWTLIDYWAEWCVPCAKLGKELEALETAHPAQVAIRRLDATAWDQTTWVKFLPDTTGLPVLDVFGPDGTLRARLIGDAAFQYRQHIQVDADQPSVALPAAATGAAQP
jgi:thiol-disulfide isomerase/thioredoxin